MTFADKVIDYYQSIHVPQNLPEGVDILYPFGNDDVKCILTDFYKKFFDDNNKRVFLIGINPGRFGGGATGIPFTDPVRMKEELGMVNTFEPKQELSSKFIYEMINHLGGPQKFYKKFYFTSVSPLGFIKEGKNLNYYDIPELQQNLEDYIVAQMKMQKLFGAHEIAFSLGMGKNIKYLKWLNKKYRLFKDIRPLPHPRWIMQYRLKRLDEFLHLYKAELSDA